jgi:hypothetical protein
MKNVWKDSDGKVLCTGPMYKAFMLALRASFRTMTPLRVTNDAGAIVSVNVGLGSERGPFHVVLDAAGRRRDVDKLTDQAMNHCPELFKR